MLSHHPISFPISSHCVHFLTKLNFHHRSALLLSFDPRSLLLSGHGLNLLFLDWIDNFCIGLGKLYCLHLILPLWWCITKVLLLAACLPLAASAAIDFLYLEDQQEEVLEETAVCVGLHHIVL
ncbi:hypothetical protein PVK06_010246 [Gossypium arboreum]|uniref:Uncharacterized protein n=1 Tax=Gossypium arboreum TaxID=29729 RepID=A0ABR0QPT6_GOSAR|nr:hypothetical protein PVK06_010246 [Gossypium arboreum]